MHNAGRWLRVALKPVRNEYGVLKEPSIGGEEPGTLSLLLSGKMGFHGRLKQKPEPVPRRCSAPSETKLPWAAGISQTTGFTKN